MVPGFEDFTTDVTDDEIATINIIAKGLNHRVGVHKAITNSDMRSLIYKNRGINISDAKMRKYIQYIRVYNLVPMLCSSKKGYWKAASKEEFIKRREAFASRIRSMQFTLAAMCHYEPKDNVINNQK